MKYLAKVCTVVFLIFSAHVSAIDIPELNVPTYANGSYKVEWSKVEGAVRYVVQGEMSGVLLNENTRLFHRENPPGVYGYKVRACSHLQWTSSCSPYSEIKYVTVQEAPSLILPQQDLDGNINVKWTSNELTSVYRLTGEQSGQIYAGSATSTIRQNVTSTDATIGYKVKACTNSTSWTCTGFSDTKYVDVIFPVLATGAASPLEVHSDETATTKEKWGGQIFAYSPTSFKFSRQNYCATGEWACARAELEKRTGPNNTLPTTTTTTISFSFTLGSLPAGNWMIIFQDYLNGPNTVNEPGNDNYPYPITELSISNDGNAYYLQHVHGEEQFNGKKEKTYLGYTRILPGVEYDVVMTLDKSEIPTVGGASIQVLQNGSQIANWIESYQTDKSDLNYRKYLFGLYATYADNGYKEIKMSDITISGY